MVGLATRIRGIGTTKIVGMRYLILTVLLVLSSCRGEVTDPNYDPVYGYTDKPLTTIDFIMQDQARFDSLMYSEWMQKQVIIACLREYRPATFIRSQCEEIIHRAGFSR